MLMSRRVALAVVLALVGSGLATLTTGSAQAASLTAVLIRTVHTGAWATPSPDPAGITYLPASGRLLISDSEVDEMSLYAGTNLFLSTLDGVQSPGDVGGTTLPWSHEPAGVGYDEARGALFVSDDDLDAIFQVQPGPDGRFGTADDSRTSFSTRPVRNGDAEDVTVEVDPLSNGHLLVIDGHDKAVYDWGPGPNGVFDAVPPTGDDTVSWFDISRYGALDPEGIAFHPTRNTLFVLDRGSGSVLEVSRNGALVNTVSIAAAQPRSAAGVTLAPPSDGSGGLNLYMVDRGVDNNSDPGENDGRFYEMAVDLPPVPDNLAPYVYAGPDRTVKMPSSAGLAGDVRDDGRPPGSPVTAAWSVVSGPGAVTFVDPTVPGTTATFGAGGTYVLRLTASDGELQASDVVTVTVTAFPPGVFEAAAAAGSDDAEERSASVSLTGNDLELVADGTTVQKVGLRFPVVALEPRATITRAYVQFTVDEATTGASSLTINGQADDNPPTFTSVSKNVSSRPRTVATISWTPPAWPTRGERGADQQTANLAPILQEIVNRPGWASGNAMALLITGSGTRTAASFERGEVSAPVLHIEYGAPSGTNATPIVSAGPDAEVITPMEASLSGWAIDDGLPVGSEIAAEWSTVDGPGDVAFDDTTAEATTATFSAGGTYVLRLTATDGELAASDDVTVTVTEPPPGVLAVPVAAGSDDGEERSASVSLAGTDLELVVDGSTVQSVGLRFDGVAVPRGVTVTAAYVQFSVDEATSATASLNIAGQAADDPPTFVAVSKDISSRPRTAASVAWTPDAWPTLGERGAAQQTPDLAPILQEIVARPGWAEGNAVALVLTGSGTRTAAASERGAAKAPVLHVEFDAGSPGDPLNAAPAADAGPDVAVTLPQAATLTGSVSDDGLPNPPGAVSAGWTTVSGPGAVTFADAGAPSTGATFSAAGDYVLRLTADDGQLQGADEVTVTVSGADTVNVEPTVNAGSDVSVTVPGPASLAGSVSDDGLPVPPGAVTAAWTTVSGPGPVVFADAAAASTTATFGAAGEYVLRLTGDDSALQAVDEVTVTVTGVLDVPVAAGTDDAEERSASVSLTGTDLELVVDDATVQTVGLRFAGVAVPAGATITRAYVQFTVDEVSTAPAGLTVAGQAADDPPGFTAVAGDVSSRPRTAATVAWTPDAWPTRSARGVEQQTPELSALVQEIVSRPGWAEGNAVALIVTGSGTRTAAAFERGAAVAPLLHIEYRM